MANPEIRFMSVYINGKKAATSNNVSMKVDPKRTVMHVQDGVVHSKGIVHTEITVKELTPVGGSSLTDIEKKILRQEDIPLAVMIGGKLHQWTMACTGYDFSSTSDTGVSEGSATFSGGVPDIEG